MATGHSNLILCKICKIQVLGAEAYEAHVNSPDHAHAVVAANSPNVKKPLDEFYINADSAYFCKICNISVTGVVPWEQHINGQQHLKKWRNQNLISSLDQVKAIHQELVPTMNRSLTTDNKMAYSPNKSVNVNVSFTRDGLSKSVESDNLLQESDKNSLSEGIESIKLNDSNDTLSRTTIRTPCSSPYQPQQNLFPFKCDTCCKRFTGIESFQQHIESAQHKKKKDLIALQGPKVYYCDLCGISLSGPIPYKQHIESMKHAKKVISNSTPPVFSPNSSVVTSTPVQYDHVKFLQSLQPINVAIEIKETAKESDMKIIDADEPFSIRGLTPPTPPSSPIPKNTKMKEIFDIEDGNSVNEEFQSCKSDILLN